MCQNDYTSIIIQRMVNDYMLFKLWRYGCMYMYVRVLLKLRTYVYTYHTRRDLEHTALRRPRSAWDPGSPLSPWLAGQWAEGGAPLQRWWNWKCGRPSGPVGQCVAAMSVESHSHYVTLSAVGTYILYILVYRYINIAHYSCTCTCTYM